MDYDRIVQAEQVVMELLRFRLRFHQHSPRLFLRLGWQGGSETAIVHLCYSVGHIAEFENFQHFQHCVDDSGLCNLGGARRSSHSIQYIAAEFERLCLQLPG